jgi:hypothetical protein
VARPLQFYGVRPHDCHGAQMRSIYLHEYNKLNQNSDLSRNFEGNKYFRWGNEIIDRISKDFIDIHCIRVKGSLYGFDYLVPVYLDKAILLYLHMQDKLADLTLSEYVIKMFGEK